MKTFLVFHCAESFRRIGSNIGWATTPWPWAAELARQGVDLLAPPTDQVFGHRTLFFRDPDGNLLEVFAEI